MDICNLLLTLPDISASQITIISNIVFFAIIGMIIIGGIIGLFRGVWNSGFRLIFVGILVILSYILAGVIGDAVANIDLSGLNLGPINIAEQQVDITTIKDTLIKVIAAYGTSSGGTIEKTLADTKTLNLITELAMMIVRLLTFIILAVAVIVVGNALATVLYHVLFKHFVNKNLRKKVKLRLVGFALGLVKSAMVMSMFIVPFSGLLNSLSSAFKKTDENGIALDSDLYKQLSSWIDAYDNSMLAQGLFGWTSDSDGKTIDMKLLDVITGTKDSTFKLTDEVGTITQVAMTLIGSNAITAEEKDGSMTAVINGSILFDAQMVSVIIPLIASSSLCTQLLPIAAEVAINSDQVSIYVDASKIDLSAIDWKNDLMVLKDFYNDIYEEGIIDSETLQNPTLMAKRIYDVNNEQIRTSIKDAFKLFDDVGVLNQVLPSFIYTLANTEDENGNNTIGDFLPTDWEDYKSIKWGSELANLYDATYRLNKVTDNAILDYVMNNDDSNKKESKVRKQNDGETNDAMSKLIDKIFEHSSSIVPIIIGSRDADGNVINVDDNGFTNETDENGNALDSCLLDSVLLSRSINKILLSTSKMSMDALAKSLEVEVSSDKLEETIKNINGIKEVKEELGYLLDVVTSIADDDTLLPILKGENIEYSDEICEALKVPASKVTKSSILTSSMPSILKAVFTKNEDQLTEFGISIDSLNFEIDDLSKELTNVLDAIPALKRVAEVNNDENKDLSESEKIKLIQSSDLEKILTVIYESDLFNHKFEDKRQNFYVVIDKLFTKIGYEGNITEGLEDIKWTGGVDSEISRFCGLFDTLKEDGFIELVYSEDKDAYLNPEILKPESIENLFNQVNDSKLLSKGLGDILDNVLLESIKEVTGDAVSFKNIVDWNEEGKNFAIMIDSLQQLNSQGVTLANIDFINSDACDSNGELLTKKLALSLVDSELFTNRQKGFGDFLFDKLKSIDAIKMSDINATSETKTYVKSQEIFDTIGNNNAWKDEVGIVFNFIKALQVIGKDYDASKINQYGTTGIEALQVAPENYKDIFIADGTTTKYGIDNFKGINSSEAFRMPITNTIYDASKNINVSSLPTLDIASNININALVNMDDVNDRNVEITTICDLLENINTLSKSSFDEIKASDEQLGSLKQVMIDIHDSKIFNTLNENKDITLFENLIQTLLSAASIEDNVICGKLNDSMITKYDTAIDVIKDIKNNQTDDSKEDEWIGLNGEITNIIQIIQDVSNVDLSNIASKSDWNDGEANALLNDLNNSKLLYRSVPYFINQFANNADTTGFSSSFDLKAVKPDYNFIDGDYIKYEEEEITSLATIIEKYSLMVDVIGTTLDLNVIRNNTNDIKDLLNALADSSVFNSESSIEGKDTVFIQVIEEMFTQSKLDEAIYDATIFDYNGKSIKENAQEKIKTFDSLTKVSSSNKNWSNEIDSILNVIDEFDETVINMDSVDVTTMNPDNVIDILRSINKSDLCYDAVPKYVKEAFGAINIGQFSNNHEDYLMKSSGSNYRDLYSDDDENTIDELDVLKNMLHGVYDNNSGYIQFDDKFKITDYVKPVSEGGKGKSLKTIIEFLTNSKVFKGCRGEVFYNAIDSAGFSENIRIKDSDKNKTFNEIFDLIEQNGENQVTREGECLDTIAINLEEVINDSKDGSDSLKSIDSSTIELVLKSCYSTTGKAWLSCEIVSGFLSNAIADSAYLDDDFINEGVVKDEWFNMWYYDNNEDYQYPLFNDLESSAIGAVIECINMIDGITFDATTHSSTLNRGMLTSIDNMFDKMHDGDNQSQVCLAVYEKAIYNSLMVSNPGICGAVHNPVVLNLYFGTDTSNKEQFETNYAFMLEDAYKDASNANFKFANVKVRVHNMLDAILATKGY